MSVSVQGLVRAGEQTWAAAGSELVPHLHAVVAAVEGLRQIRKLSQKSEMCGYIVERQ